MDLYLFEYIERPCHGRFFAVDARAAIVLHTRGIGDIVFAASQIGASLRTPSPEIVARVAKLYVGFVEAIDVETGERGSR